MTIPTSRLCWLVGRCCGLRSAGWSLSGWLHAGEVTTTWPALRSTVQMRAPPVRKRLMASRSKCGAILVEAVARAGSGTWQNEASKPPSTTTPSDERAGSTSASRTRWRRVTPHSSPAMSSRVTCRSRRSSACLPIVLTSSESPLRACPPTRPGWGAMSRPGLRRTWSRSDLTDRSAPSSTETAITRRSLRLGALRGPDSVVYPSVADHQRSLLQPGSGANVQPTVIDPTATATPSGLDRATTTPKPIATSPPKTTEPAVPPLEPWLTSTTVLRSGR